MDFCIVNHDMRNSFAPGELDYVIIIISLVVLRRKKAVTKPRTYDTMCAVVVLVHAPKVSTGKIDT